MINKKANRKLSKSGLWSGVVGFIVILALIACLAGVGGILFLLKDKPKLNVDDFKSQESSIVYDRNGNVVAELGATIRENITYDDLPVSLVDAFVAVEDSRFFVHNGFDVPRFTKAFLSNLRTLSFSQGGSTFTMQLVKNTYFSNDETGQTASRNGLSGVARKVQEIALAMELENNSSLNKRTILELYLNKLNFGGSKNIRGVQKASEYYFGKDVNQLTLPESAFLAGVVNAPNAFNPFNNLDLATNRRDEVLYLMKYHGYITQEEYDLAVSVKLEDLLNDPYTNAHNGNGTPYQAYVDQVINEVYDLTGLDPFSTTMKIYTYMDPTVQGAMDNLQSDENGLFEYPDDYFEIASIAVDNSTGAVVGILGGRNYANGGALLLNHATQQFKNPGSSIKPILDYSLAFENLGWATDHVLVDRPLVYEGTEIIIPNAYGSYRGQITLKTALGISCNTTAIQTLEQVIEKTSVTHVVEYLNKIGFNVSIEDFNTQYGIGGSTFTVTPLQMAAAQAMLINAGTYNTPHTISRIEFVSEKAPITVNTQSLKVMSEQAAYLTTDLMKNNVDAGYSAQYTAVRDDYAVYAKTGTTDWGTYGTSYGIPAGSIKDGWLVASTSKYTVATWIGYEKASKNQQSYIKEDVYYSNIQGKTTNRILDTLVDVYGKPSPINKPDGIKSITHIIATYPYAATIDGMDEKYITTGLIATKDYQLVNPANVNIQDMPGDAHISLDGYELSINWPEYPDEDAIKHNDAIDISLKNSSGEVVLPATGTKLFDYSWVYGKVCYKADITITSASGSTKESTITTDEHKATKQLSLSPGDTVKVKAYYSYEDKDITSSTKTSKSFSIADEVREISFPNSSMKFQSKSDFENWWSSHNGSIVRISVSTQETSDSDRVGTVKFSDTTTKRKTSEWNKITLECTYYVEKSAPTPSIAISTNGEGTVFYATVPDYYKDYDIKWYANGSKVGTGSSIDASEVSGASTLTAVLGDDLAETSITLSSSNTEE